VSPTSPASQRRIGRTGRLPARGDRITAPNLADEHKVSKRVALHVLAILAANRYLADVPFQAYYVTWETAHGRTKARE